MIGSFVNGSVPSTANGAYIGNFNGNSRISRNEIRMNNYAEATGEKHFWCCNQAGYSSEIYLNVVGSWAGTAAINSITLSPGGTAFAAGTIATLYGEG